MKLKKFTIDDVKAFCSYEEHLHLKEAFSAYLEKDWEVTVLDILKNKKIDAYYKFRIVLRDELLSSKVMRLFAVACARRVQHLRNVNAIDDSVYAIKRFALAALHAAHAYSHAHDYDNSDRAAAYLASSDARDAASYAHLSGDEREEQVKILIQLIKKYYEVDKK